VEWKELHLNLAIMLCSLGCSVLTVLCGCFHTSFGANMCTICLWVPSIKPSCSESCMLTVRLYRSCERGPVQQAISQFDHIAERNCRANIPQIQATKLLQLGKALRSVLAS